jgi:hypothetical protein
MPILGLRQQAIIERFVEIRNGEPVYDAHETTRCRIEKTSSINLGGSSGVMTRTSTTRMFTPPIEWIPERSRVTTLHDNKAYEVGACSEAWGFRKNHLELRLI